MEVSFINCIDCGASDCSLLGPRPPLKEITHTHNDRYPTWRTGGIMTPSCYWECNYKWKQTCTFAPTALTGSLQVSETAPQSNTAKTSRPSITLWGREMKSPLKRLAPKANHFPQTPMLKWLLINCNCRHFRKKSGRNLCCDASLRSRRRSWWKKSVSEWIICKVT